MKFTDYILTDAINPELKATDKDEVIREMVQSLVDAGDIKEEDYEAIVKAIVKREELGSTAYGRGIALPEARHPNVERLVVAVGISIEGIDFGSFDDKKTHIFFLVSSPSPGDLLRVMEHLTRRLKDDAFICSLKQAKTREGIVALLEEADNRPLTNFTKGAES